MSIAIFATWKSDWLIGWLAYCSAIRACSAQSCRHSAERRTVAPTRLSPVRSHRPTHWLQTVDGAPRPHCRRLRRRTPAAVPGLPVYSRPSAAHRRSSVSTTVPRRRPRRSPPPDFLRATLLSSPRPITLDDPVTRGDSLSTSVCLSVCLSHHHSSGGLA